MNLSQFKVVPNKELKGSFGEIVRHLRRPYISLSKKQYDNFVEIATRSNSDFFEKDGQLYTFGTADGGYALMPYSEAIYL